jgi:hypothetical protein
MLSTRPAPLRGLPRIAHSPVTTTDAQLRIRPPVWLRIATVGFLAVWLYLFFVEIRPFDLFPPAVVVGVTAALFGLRTRS